VRRLLGFLPLALLGGCGLRPWTPSVSVAFWAEDVPAGREVNVPRGEDLSRAWLLSPDSAWAKYDKATLFTAVDEMGGSAVLPDVRTLEIVGKAQQAAQRVGTVGLPRDTMWVVDLRGAASCAFVSTLSHTASEPIAPVVTFNNWPADDELVPADETLAGALAFPPKLPPAEATTAPPVFVLDSWRLAYRYDEPASDTYDNRYILTQADFPDVATLQQQGIRRVVYVVEDLDDAEVEEDDLHATFRAYQEAGINIYMVDLGFLDDLRMPVDAKWGIDWAARLEPQYFHCGPRYVIVDDPVFYGRARAGFGLARGRPVISHGGGSGGGWGRFGGGSGSGSRGGGWGGAGGG
jgi:hypothetical protein